jgi:hypothetical protein
MAHNNALRIAIRRIGYARYTRAAYPANEADDFSA